MEENNKPTYEQLEVLAHNLQSQLIKTQNVINSINMSEIRLRYLLKVIKNKEAFPENFIQACVKEIMELMTIPEGTPSTKE